MSFDSAFKKYARKAMDNPAFGRGLRKHAKGKSGGAVAGAVAGAAVGGPAGAALGFLGGLAVGAYAEHKENDGKWKDDW